MGWVSVRFEDTSCPATGWFLKRIRVGADGKGCAPFPYPEGWHAEFTLYTNSDGSVRKLPLGLGEQTTDIGQDPVFQD